MLTWIHAPFVITWSVMSTASAITRQLAFQIRRLFLNTGSAETCSSRRPSSAALCRMHAIYQQARTALAAAAPHALVCAAYQCVCDIKCPRGPRICTTQQAKHHVNMRSTSLACPFISSLILRGGGAYAWWRLFFKTSPLELKNKTSKFGLIGGRRNGVIRFSVPWNTEGLSHSLTIEIFYSVKAEL